MRINRALGTVLGSLPLVAMPSTAVAAPSDAPHAQHLHLVCGSAEYDIVSPVERFFAALVEGTNMVAVLKGINGQLFTGVPESKLTTCETFADGEFLFTASVLFTPQR